MDGPWSDYGSGDTATATAPDEDQGPWSDFEPGVAAPVQAPDLSKIKLSPVEPPSPAAAIGATGFIAPPSEELASRLIAAPMRAIGSTLAGMGRAARDLMTPTTWLPEDQKPQAPFVLPMGEGDIRPRTPTEVAAADPLQVGKPLYEPEPGSPTSEHNELARLLSRWSTPESLAVLPASKNPIAGALLLTSMIPGFVQQVKDAVSRGGTDEEKRDRVNDLVSLAALTISHRAAPAIRVGVTSPPDIMPGSGELQGPLATGELLKMPEGSAVPPKVPFNLPDAARAPEPAVVPPKAEAPAPAPPGEAAKPRTLTPALLVDGKPVTGAGEHADIFKAEIAKADDPKMIDALFKAQGDDNLHVFVDENGAPLTRLEAAKAFKEITGKDVSDPKKGLQSQDLIEVGLQKPAAKAPAAPEQIAAPESVKGGAESGLSPEAQAKSRANNSLRKMAEANGVEFVEGDTPQTVLAKINAKASQPAAAPTAPTAEPVIRESQTTPPPAAAPEKAAGPQELPRIVPGFTIDYEFRKQWEAENGPLVGHPELKSKYLNDLRVHQQSIITEGKAIGPPSLDDLLSSPKDSTRGAAIASEEHGSEVAGRAMLDAPDVMSQIGRASRNIEAKERLIDQGWSGMEAQEIIKRASAPKPAAPEKGMKGMGGAVPSEFEGNQDYASNMFDAINRDRVAMGKKPMGETNPRTWDEDNQRAWAQMRRDPNWIPDLLDRMEKNPRPLLSWENAGVVWHRAKLKAEYNGALQRVARAFDDNRTEDLTAAKTDAAVFEDKLERLDRIVGRNGTGSEAGRSLNAQKMGAGDDFTLVEMTLQKRAAVGGRRLTPQETSAIQKDVDRLNSLNAALQKSLADSESKASAAEAARAIAELKTSLPSFDQRVLKAAENIVVKMEGRAVDASARLREKLMRMSAGVDPTIIYDASIIGSAKIARLGLNLAKFTDAMVKDFGDKIRPMIADIWQKSNEMLEANLARVPEPIRRVVKKTGAQDIRKEVAAAVKSNVDAGDMSKVTWQVQKLARELVKSGITDREALIDAVHDALKDVIPGITRRGAMDAISGYGDFKRLSKDRISLTLRGMKGEMQQLAKLEDMAGGKPPLKTGIERREVTPEERRLIKEVNDAKNKFQVPIDNPETQLKSALDTLKATLKNRIADFEDRLARKDYSPRPRREVQLDTEATRLRAEAERIKKRWRETLLADRMKNRTIWEKALDWGTKFRRFTALSSPAVIPKLLGAAGWRAVSTLAEDISGRAVSLIPGIRQISQRAPLEGAGGQLAATMRGFGTAFTRGLEDAAKVTKTGHSDIDVLYGKASESYTGESEMASVLLGLPGRLHGTIKAPVKRGAFEKATQRLGEFYARQGLDVTSDPVKYRIALEAYKAGNRSIFLQDNRVASGFNAALQALEKKGETGHPSPGGKVLATAARFMFPVTRVPTNIAAETLQYATGSVTGSARAINAIRKGLDTLTPDQADLIMRELKKGSIGLAALYLGYMGYQSVGGVYEQGKKRKPGDVKPDAARLFGVDIPGNLLHAPVLNTIQLGATVRRTAEDKLRRKDPDAQGISAGVLAASWGLAEEVPFIQGPSRLFQGLKSPYTRQQTVGNEVGSVVIPQAVAWLAQVLDQRRETPPANLYQRITGPPARLKPRNIGESLETRIPGLRQNVPVNPKAASTAPAAAVPPWEQFQNP